MGSSATPSPGRCTHQSTHQEISTKIEYESQPFVYLIDYAKRKRSNMFGQKITIESNHLRYVDYRLLRKILVALIQQDVCRHICQSRVRCYCGT